MEKDKLLRIRTTEGYTIKTLSELLQSNIKIGCFIIDETSIKFCMMDHHRKILIDLDLQYENFTVYKLNAPVVHIGINLSHLYKMIKDAKKKDSIEFSIDMATPDQLCIKIFTPDNARVTTSHIKIQEMQNVEMNLPSGYEKPIIISSSEYQKMSKNLNSIDHCVEISSNGNFVKFKADMTSVYSRDIVFGEMDDRPIIYNHHFEADQLCRLSKLSGLSKNIQIYVKNELPILFRSNVGNLGRISIYLKSKEQIITEAETENA